MRGERTQAVCFAVERIYTPKEAHLRIRARPGPARPVVPGYSFTG